MLSSRNSKNRTVNVQAIDSAVLRDRLSDLSEVFGAKAVSEKGLTVWFNVLREFPTEKVCGVLIGWPKSHGKMPTPNEVWKSVNEICISEREQKVAEERRRAPFEPEVSGEQAEHFINQMRTLLKRPVVGPREHWERVLRTAAPGSIGHQYATEALMKMGALSREPGQDEEEPKAKAVNF